MKTLSVVVALFLASSAWAQYPGGTSGGKPPPPEWIRQQEATGVLRNRIRDLERQGKWQEVITACKDLIALESRPPMAMKRHSHAYWRLARAYEQLDQSPDALDAYQKSISWIPEFADWDGNQFQVLDYAISAAKQGQVEKAKEMYYLGLRKYNAAKIHEDLPFLVVFDPDPGMDYWEYSTVNLEAAARMLKIVGGQVSGDVAEWVKISRGELPNPIDIVLSLKPDWLIPQLMKAGGHRAEKAKSVLGYVHTQREHQWLAEWALEDRVKDKERRMLSNQMRKLSKVVQKVIPPKGKAFGGR